MPPLFVAGDIHGQYVKMTAALRQAGMLAADLSWAGKDATLWFMGDFVDRGPDGLKVIELVMRLQQEAPGRVHALLGNHEPLLLAAHRFGIQPAGGPGGTFLSGWQRNGGVASDLAGLTPAHIAWITSLPAMALVGERLFLHADALFYARYGASVDEVNRSFRALLTSDDPAAWDRLLNEFSERDAFIDAQPGGQERARFMLQRFGGRQLVHGHTPICRTTGQEPGQVTGPLVYAGGLCVNVDPGMYAGGPGFVTELDP